MTRRMIVLTLVCCLVGIVVAFKTSISSAINQNRLANNNKLTHLKALESSDPTLVIPPLTKLPPYKVLLLVEPTPFTYISGYSNRFKEMLNYLHKANDSVHIFTPDSGSRGPPPNEYLGYPITTVRGFELVFYKHVTLSYDLRFKIPKIIKEFKPDLIHCATPSALIYPAALWGKVLGVPLLASYHTDFVKYGRTYVPYAPDSAERLAKWFLTTLLSFADLILCTSPQLKDSILELGLPKVDVWRKGINAEVFSPSFRSSSMRDFLTQGHPDSPILIYVGRLGKEKRLDRLKKVLEENPTCRLALVGSGPAEAELRQLLSGELSSRVHFTGPLTGKALSEAFASSDVFLMPSDSETLGFVVLEAMASGLPVVGVAAGGLLDIIDDGVNGFLVSNTDDVIEFSERTRQLVQDSELRRRVGAQGREYAQLWSWESATSVLRNIQYPKAIENFRQKCQAKEAKVAAERTQAEAVQQEKANLYRPDLA